MRNDLLDNDNGKAEKFSELGRAADHVCRIFAVRSSPGGGFLV